LEAALFCESGEAVDGEEFTNKIPRFEQGWNSNRQTHQMCLIHTHFKHFARRKAKQFRQYGKVSSIMRAKVLSIMTAKAGLVTLG
jgi:hypothetical protein